MIGSSWRKWKHLWIFYVLVIASNKHIYIYIGFFLQWRGFNWMCWNFLFFLNFFLSHPCALKMENLQNSFSLLTMLFLLFVIILLLHHRTRRFYTCLHSFEHNIQINTHTHTHKYTMNIAASQIHTNYF